LLYRFKAKFGHGLYTAWQRDVTRWKILETEPVSGLSDETCEIHVLTCERDWLDLIWSLKSFFAVCERRFTLCIHDDGSVSSAGLASLREHFPDARVISRKEADEHVEGEFLRDHTRCKALRQTNVLSLKVFDFAAYLRAPRLLLIDSDILFFGRPSVLLERICDQRYELNSLNKDWGLGYTVEPAHLQKMLDFEFQAPINSGLGLMHRDSYQLDWFEQWLALPGVVGHPHRIEQTLVGLASSRFGHEFLPKEYDVTLDGTRPTELVKHYTGPIRHLLYREGLRRTFSILKSKRLSSDAHPRAVVRAPPV
jgi:hypothetical protein